ncbi:outer membrane OmpH-like protein [Hymenobacter chitinivorans DSM 11115]|uniref:Outer membrane OmpH-like protein n=2 Tax=Hymenobacter chitinivorans TaxID=89969 RepID=A0A2M9BNQ1_9BACT|nr:outer membrane OmpH-like protein [Hymenobacter chitinivorans DSM 11115]
MQEYHAATAQQQVFQAKAKVWQQRIDSLKTELDALPADGSAKRAYREQELLRYRDAIQQQAQQEDQRLAKGVMEEVNAYIKQYGKEKGYRFILGATNQGNIVYAAEGTDLTDEILEGLNKQYDALHPQKP